VKKPAKGKPARPAAGKAPVRKVVVKPKQPGKHPGRGGSPGVHAGPVHRPVLLPAKGKPGAVVARAKAHPKRKLALGEGVACCSAEALAASLRLAGHAVSDADVLALYWLTASGADDGATILATLEAAQEHGLAGVRPVSFLLHAAKLVGEAVQPVRGKFEQPVGHPEAAHVAVPAARLSEVPHGATLSLILGTTLPGGEHAVTLDPSGAVWSWGDLYRLPDIDIEEAWLVDWEA
jgi:hypothetical protein